MTPNRGFRTAPLNNLRGRPGEASQQPCSQEQMPGSSGLWPPCSDLRLLSATPEEHWEAGGQGIGPRTFIRS